MSSPACPRGAILATAVVLGAVKLAASESGARYAQVPPVGPLTGAQFDLAAASPWAFGPWAWLLGDVRQLPAPVPCKGALGLWRVPADVEAAVLKT